METVCSDRAMTKPANKPASRLQVPKELEGLIEKRESESDRRKATGRQTTNERRQKRRRKSDK
jgi:hypothetical protein